MEICIATESEQSSIDRLFEDSFGYRLSPQLWDWKYASPKGRNLIFKENGRVLAHYGGMQRDISYFGQAEKAIQIGDVMVAKNAQGILKKKGLYFQLTAAFLERYIGYETEHLLGFGFPTPKALKLACKLKLYAVVDEIIELRYPAIDSRPSYQYKLCELTQQNAADFAHALDQLWLKMRADFKHDILVERNWKYLNYRYICHPNKAYKSFIMLHRLSRKVLGLLIFKYQKEAERWILLDFVASEQYWPTLFIQAGRIAKHLGTKNFTCWITKSHMARLPDNWQSSNPANILVPTNIWHQGPKCDEIQGKWWLTAGDTDFL